MEHGAAGSPDHSPVGPVHGGTLLQVISQLVQDYRSDGQGLLGALLGVLRTFQDCFQKSVITWALFTQESVDGVGLAEIISYGRGSQTILEKCETKI